MFYHTPTFLKKIFCYFFAALLLLYSISCNNYYQVNRTDSAGLVNLFRMGDIQKTYIIHSGYNVYGIKNITADSISLSGELYEVSPYNYHYVQNPAKKYKQEEKSILYEVHIYLHNDGRALSLGQQDIPIQEVNEIHIIDKDKGLTATSYVLGTLGVLAGVAVLVGIIVALTKSSCPYIYVNDGEGFVFEGEIFGGAILKNMERDDYMPLPSIKAIDGNYELRITNELKERQYTNLAELITVNHAKGEKVLLDKYGKPYLIGSLNQAKTAVSVNGTLLNHVLKNTDKSVFFFNDEEADKNFVHLKFTKPEYASEGQLVLNAKNTLWFDYLFGDFSGKFGNYFDEWNQKQETVPTEERMQKVIDNGFPLSVYQKIDGEWTLLDHILTVGPLASRDFVIPIDLNKSMADEIEIKLETGFMFWEIDYAGMSFTIQKPMEIQTLKAHEVLSSDGINHAASILEDDSLYLAQEDIGDVAELHFKYNPPKQGFDQSVFLHTKGYYELIREFEGDPDILGLMKFQTPGYFMTYSKEKYMETLQPADEI